MFRKILTVLLFLFATLTTSFSQNSCFHTLVMNDAFGDGWEAAEVIVYVNGVANNFTLDGMNDDGFTNSVDFTVSEGDSISVEYIPGTGAEIEHSYVLHDSDDQLLFESGNPPASGVVFTHFVLCPLCPALPSNTLSTVDVLGNSAQIDWDASNAVGNYVIEYQECGMPNTQVSDMTADTDYTFLNLMENTCYEYYIYLVCASGDTSIVLSDEFTTIFNVDVGVSGILRPFNGQKCEYLNSDTLEIFIKNYGTFPQANIPFNYSINGEGGVQNIPTDGLYTGVIGKDSCHNIAFEAPINISSPGAYEIKVWTEFYTSNQYALTTIDDGDMSNDTFTYTFIHTYELPFKEKFETADLPNQWNTNLIDPIYQMGDHGNVTGVIGSYMSDLNGYFSFSTARYGILGMDEELLFDYRFVTVNGAGNAQAHQIEIGEMLTVEVSSDCGASWEVLGLINESNHNNTASSSMRTLNYSLAAYAGESVEFRFTMIRNSDEFWADFDDIQIYNCDNGLFDILEDVNVVDETVEGENNGSITIVNVTGIEPITYDWGSVAGNTNTVSNLGSGIYSVTVTDAEGCEQTEFIEVRALVADQNLAALEALNIYPNPVKNDLHVQASFSELKTIHLCLYNSLGQLILERDFEKNQEISSVINVSGLNTGLYLLNLSDGQGQISRKIIVD